MFRRRPLERLGGFPPGLGPAADYSVYLELARSEGVLYHDYDIVRYRQHEASMSRDPALMLHSTLEVLRRERRAVPSSTRRDVKRGEIVWRAYYGEQIIGTSAE